MTTASKIAWDDMILPFSLDRSDIRGRVVRLDRTLDQILGQHDYPPKIEALVAEAALLTALIGQAVKLRWRLSLQTRSDAGAVRVLATDYFAPATEDAPARLRAYAHYDADRLEEAQGAALLGQGLFAITIDQGPDMAPYQGITPLGGASLADTAATYFAQSEQLPTRFALRARKTEAGWRAGGVMLQAMPDASPGAVQDAPADGLLRDKDLLGEEAAENWVRTGYLLETVKEDELIGPEAGMDRLLIRLFHEEIPRVYDGQPVGFGCTCSEEKVRDALAAYDAETLAQMRDSAGQIIADCQFCGAKYRLEDAG